MLSWVASDPDRMARIVEIADEWLLVRGAALTQKFTSPHKYNPAKCFSVGVHHGVKIVRVMGKIHLFAHDEERSIASVSLLPYTQRKGADRNEVYAEAHRLKLVTRSSVDDMWAGLLHSVHSPEKSVLAMEGSVNEFNVPFSANGRRPWYFPVQLKYIEAEQGWEVHALECVSATDPLRKNTHLILDGNQNE